MKQREIGFTQGVGYAIQYLINGHGENSLAEYLMQESGIHLSDFEKVCDDMDLEYIRKAAAE